MPLDLENLDARTRSYMLAELERDVAGGTLYLSPCLSARGKVEYEDLLRVALRQGTDGSLAGELARHERVTPARRWGQPAASEVPDRARRDVSASLAEREFHRFYVRGLCLRALAEGIPRLVIYRAGPSTLARAHADAMVGVQIDAGSLLEDLRCAARATPPRGLPPCSDPRLSVRLP